MILVSEVAGILSICEEGKAETSVRKRGPRAQFCGKFPERASWERILPQASPPTICWAARFKAEASRNTAVMYPAYCVVKKG